MSAAQPSVAKIEFIPIFGDKADRKGRVLFVIAGVSHKSTQGTTSVVQKNSETLEQTFTAAYAVFLPLEYVQCQKEACEKRDTLPDGDANKFRFEEFMNQKIAHNIHQHIEENNFTNVHLLGKCNGAWVALELFLLGKGVYKNLYSAVPGIPPNGILEKLKAEEYKGSKILFGFVAQDAFPFLWGKSNQELSRYKRELQGISVSFQTYNIAGAEPHEKDHHELPAAMIQDIIDM